MGEAGLAGVQQLGQVHCILISAFASGILSSPLSLALARLRLGACTCPGVSAGGSSTLLPASSPKVTGTSIRFHFLFR